MDIPRFITMTEKDTRLQPACDVLVAGGGPAGVSAAIAAARAGASTVLLELQGCLGGVWTAGLLSVVLDVKDKSGFLTELINELETETAAPLNHFQAKDYGRMADFYYDPEVMKLVLERLCQQAGVQIQLHTRITAAVVDQGRLTHAISESKSGRQAWSAKCFIDSTGDGDLAALAGCQWDYGRASDGAAQPLSMMALLSGIDPEAVAPFTNGHPGYTDLDTKQALLDELRRAGEVPSYTRPSLFHLGRSLFCLAANHQYGASGLDAVQVTQATFAARAEIHQLVKALRRLGGIWADIQLVATSSHIGVRDGRRIHGRYQLTVNDLLEGRRHLDAVCTVNFPVDVHATTLSGSGGSYSSEGVHSKPYDIPLRALEAGDVDSLLLAGRCISGDFLAHASYRVTGNAVPIGEAAGKEAARRAKNV